MRVQTFDELKEAYSGTNCGLDADDIAERNRLLSQQPFSVIVEGGWLELESLEKWATEKISEMPLNQVWYGKLSYDFGCTEYFFNNREHADALALVIPRIYTRYPDSHPPGLVCKSEGYDSDILYNSEDETALVF